MKTWTRLKDRYAAGLCRWCQNPRPLGYATCEVCRKRLAKYKAGHYAKRRAAGLCRNCNEPRHPGSNTFCRAHHQENAEACKRRRKALAKGATT
jgi:hypothetical protein